MGTRSSCAFSLSLTTQQRVDKLRSRLTFDKGLASRLFPDEPKPDVPAIDALGFTEANYAGLRRLINCRHPSLTGKELLDAALLPDATRGAAFLYVRSVQRRNKQILRRQKLKRGSTTLQFFSLSRTVEALLLTALESVENDANARSANIGRESGHVGEVAR